MKLKMKIWLGVLCAFCVVAAFTVYAQVQSTVFGAHEARVPTPTELNTLVDIRSNVQDQIDSITGYNSSGGTTFSNVFLASGTNAGVVDQLPYAKGEIIYGQPATNGNQWTNSTGRRGYITIPFSQTAAAYNALLIVTNYTGSVGGVGTVTNVTVASMGSAATPTAGSNTISGWLFPNSVVVFSNTVGTVAILNTTNGQPTFYAQ